jgi:hypothetical protein
MSLDDDVAYFSLTTWRLTDIFWLSSTPTSKSSGRIAEGADRLGLRHRLVGVVDRLLHLGAQVRVVDEVGDRLADLPLASAQPGKASGSIVISAAMNGCRRRPP